MNSFLKGTCLLLSIVVPGLASLAQMKPSRFEIGLTGGAFVYQGDLTPSAVGSYRTMRPTGNLFAHYILSPAFSLRTSLFFGGLSGNDAAYEVPAWREQRAFRFTGTMLELSELLVWNAWSTDKKFTPYLFAGAGLSYLSIRRDWSRFNGEFFMNEDLALRLAEDMAHPMPRLVPVVPVGAGVRISLSNKFSAIAETAYRLTGTDYLDGFSKAGNPDLADHYQSHTVGLVYTFGKKSKMDCPVIVQ